MENKQDWTKIIRSEESFFKLNLKEILEYKDLIQRKTLLQCINKLYWDRCG